jgi:membrane protease YdiL (CAAX protease family)
MIDSPYNKPYNQIHPGLQFLIFSALFLLVLIVGNLIGAAIAAALYGVNAVTDALELNLTSPHAAAVLWILQTTGTTFPIITAPVIFAVLIVREPAGYIKPNFKFKWTLLLVVLAVMFFSNPAIEFLSNLNQKMVLPPWLKWMRDSEDSAEKLMEVMLQMKTIPGLIFDVLLIGLVPAIIEEFMFRGVLQTIFVRWTKNTHVAIWITAILFSAFHMEFFGFLPRLLLGALFGYFVAWSGSIWPAVWAHFLNNATAVIATYLYQHKHIKANPDDQHLFNTLSYLISFALMFNLLLLYRKIASKKINLPADINGEELG